MRLAIVFSMTMLSSIVFFRWLKMGNEGCRVLLEQIPMDMLYREFHHAVLYAEVHYRLHTLCVHRKNVNFFVCTCTCATPCVMTSTMAICANIFTVFIPLIFKISHTDPQTLTMVLMLLAMTWIRTLILHMVVICRIMQTTISR